MPAVATNRLPLYGLLAALLLVFHLALLTKAWALWGIPRPVDQPFIDMYALLAASDCNQQGHDVFVDNPCDWLGRPHVYPRTWLALHAFGLGREDNVLLGYLIGLGFFVSLAVSTRPERWGDALVALLVGISPGVMLGVERANFDLVAFAIVAALVVLRSVWAGGALILVAGSLKIYPLVVALPWAWENRARKGVGIATAAVGLVTALGLWMWREDWPKMAMYVPAPTNRFFTMGAPLLFQQLGVGPSVAVGRAALIVGAIAAIAYGRVRLQLVERRFELLLGATVLLFCFFARTNYDYRWVYLGLVLPAALRAGAVGGIVVAASGVVLWTEGVVTWLGHLAPSIMAPVVGMAPFVDHAASWIVVLGSVALAAAGKPSAER